MKYRGSQIAGYIDQDFKKEKEWKKKVERMKELKEKNKSEIIILDEHSREPLIIEKKEVK